MPRDGAIVRTAMTLGTKGSILSRLAKYITPCDPRIVPESRTKRKLCPEQTVDDAGQKSASGTCAENTSNARGSRWSDLLSLSEPQFSIACGDRPPHSLPRSFTRLIFSPLPLRRQSPFGVGLMSLLGSPVRAESDLALLIASTLSTPTACFRCVYRLCSGQNRTL